MACGLCPEDRHLGPEDRHLSVFLGPGEDLPTSHSSLSHPGLLLISAPFCLELYLKCMGWVYRLGTSHCAEGFDTFYLFLLTRLSGPPASSDPHFFPRKENLWGWLLMGMWFLLWVWKCPHVGSWWWLHNPVNIRKTTELYTLQRWTLRYVNYISLKRL